MFNVRFIPMLLAMLLALAGLTACHDDDGADNVPTFSAITISPQQEVYHVGDVITCEITRLSSGSDQLRADTYWWYASWWFADPNLTADFQDFDSANKCVSEQITLTQEGEVTLYFFGRLEYPNFDWKKIEIGKTITVLP